MGGRIRRDRSDDDRGVRGVSAGLLRARLAGRRGRRQTATCPRCSGASVRVHDQSRVAREQEGFRAESEQHIEIVLEFTPVHNNET
jgi:hypothetical protein